MIEIQSNLWVNGNHLLRDSDTWQLLFVCKRAQGFCVYCHQLRTWYWWLPKALWLWRGKAVVQLQICQGEQWNLNKKHFVAFSSANSMPGNPIWLVWRERVRVKMTLEEGRKNMPQKDYLICPLPLISVCVYYWSLSKTKSQAQINFFSNPVWWH